jgi:hypothetical protein
MYIMTTKRGNKKLSNKSKSVPKPKVAKNVLGAETEKYPSSLWYEPHHVSYWYEPRRISFFWYEPLSCPPTGMNPVMSSPTGMNPSCPLLLV